MAEETQGEGMVPLEEVVLAQAFELQAILNVLERRGLLARQEVLEEIKRLREATPKASGPARPSSASGWRRSGGRMREAGEGAEKRRSWPKELSSS